MRLASGACKINGVHIVNVEIDNVFAIEKRPLTMDVPANMKAIYATVEGVTGSAQEGTRGTVIGTHGKCTAYPENWSDETLDLLTQLLDSMERDLLPQHFEVGASEEGEHARLEPGEDEAPKQI